MPTVYGKAFSGTDKGKLAPGTSHDAATRGYRNTFELAVNGGGGTASALLFAKVREGSNVHGFDVTSDVNLSGINFTIGTDAEPAKYCAAFAGPAANATVRPQVKIGPLMADALTRLEEIKLFPNVALPAAGNIVARATATHR